MGPDPIQALIQEDQRLHVGDSVVAHWSKNGYHYHARAKIAALTNRRVKVKLLETPTRGEGFSRGDIVELPRISDHERWSSGACVRRIGAAGY